MAVGVALSVAGIVVTAIVPAVLSAMQAGDSNTLPFISGSECGSVSGNGLGSFCSARLGPDGFNQS
jgi:hypothetical protein